MRIIINRRRIAIATFWKQRRRLLPSKTLINCSSSMCTIVFACDGLKRGTLIIFRDVVICNTKANFQKHDLKCTITRNMSKNKNNPLEEQRECQVCLPSTQHSVAVRRQTSRSIQKRLYSVEHQHRFSPQPESISKCVIVFVRAADDVTNQILIQKSAFVYWTKNI